MTEPENREAQGHLAHEEPALRAQSKPPRSRTAGALFLIAALVLVSGLALLIAGYVPAFLLALGFAVLLGAIGYFFRWSRRTALALEPATPRPLLRNTQTPYRSFPPYPAEAPPSGNEESTTPNPEDRP